MHVQYMEQIKTITVSAGDPGTLIDLATHAPGIEDRGRVAYSFHGSHSAEVELRQVAAEDGDPIPTGQRTWSGPYLRKTAPTWLYAAAATDIKLTIYKVI